MKVTCTTLVLAVCLVLTTGCSEKPRANFKLQPRRVTIVTQPAGATVTQLRPLRQAPVKLGLTPLRDQVVTVFTDIQMQHMPFRDGQELLQHAGNLVMRIEKEGYEIYQGVHPTQADRINEFKIELQPKP